MEAKLSAITKRSFWSECPRKLGYFPETACPLGRLGSDSPLESDLACNWYIKSEEHNYCFWTWLRSVSNEDGVFEPLMHNELSELLNCSSTKIHFSLKQAFQNLEKIEEFQALKEYIHSK